MPDFIVYIRKNHMEAVNLKNGASAAGTDTFTSTRFLVGNYEVAKSLLRQLIHEVYPIGMWAKLFAMPLRVVIQPLEMTEGGLTEVESRLLAGLVWSTMLKVCCVRSVKIFVGDRLDREGALSFLDENK